MAGILERLPGGFLPDKEPGRIGTRTQEGHIFRLGGHKAGWQARFMDLDPTTAANTLATVIGLICNWKAERGAAAADKFQDFLTYLTDHHFEALRSDIAASQNLQVQLRGLLTLNLAAMSEQLNAVSQGIAALSGKLDAMAPLARAIGASGEGLSEQASQILKVLEQTDSTSMVEEPGGGGAFQFLPSSMGISFSETRFISSDLDALENLGMIKRSWTPDPSIKLYEITRFGAQYAAKLPMVNIGKSEE